MTDRDQDRVLAEFRRCDAAHPPASDLIAAVLAEYDAVAGRALSGGPSATPSDFSPPGGAYIVGFVDGAPACGGGIKALGDGNAELKRMYVAPQFRGRGLARALLQALESTARDLGHRAVRLDSQSVTWPMYLAAGYRADRRLQRQPARRLLGREAAVTSDHGRLSTARRSASASPIGDPPASAPGPDRGTGRAGRAAGPRRSAARCGCAGAGPCCPARRS